MPSAVSRRPSAHRTAVDDGARELLYLMIAIWFVAFKWSFIFGAIGKHALKIILYRSMAFFLPPMGMLAHAIWWAEGAPSSVIWTSISIFSPAIVYCAFSLHVACGSWIGSAFMPMWCFIGVILPMLYDVPARIRSPFTAVVAFVHFADMAVDFKLAAALPAFIAEFLFAVHRGMRLVIPLEPDPSFPPTVYSCMWLNNFFTPMAILLWVLLRVTWQRRLWQAKSDEVLYNLVPEEIADQLRCGTPSNELTRHHQNVTCFFSDIVGFTAMCDRTEDPTKVMEVLQNMYRSFDYLAELTGAYKIETIGDAYFAVATLHDRSITAEESCYRIALFALAVREFIRGPFGQICNINVRVGLHTGDLVAGVMGDLRPRFVLVGDTVNTASRMETAAESDMINVSESSARLLQNYFQLTPRPLAEVKGKGLVQMYELGDPLCNECPYGLLPPNQLAIVALQQLKIFNQQLPYRMGHSARALFDRAMSLAVSQTGSDAPAGPDGPATPAEGREDSSPCRRRTTSSESTS